MATSKTSYKNSSYSFTRYPSTILAVQLNTPVTCCSFWNNSGSPVKPAPAHGWAIIHMLHNQERKFGIAYDDTNKRLLLEMAAVKSSTRKVLIYDQNTKEVFAGVFDENDTLIDTERPSVRYLATLHLISIIASHQETEKYWRECQQEFASSGKSRIYLSSSVSYLLDALYFSIGQEFPDIDLATDMADLPYPCDGNFRDITNDILGVQGEFTYAKITSTNANKKSAKSQSALTLDSLKDQYSVYTKDFFDSLSDDEKALIPKKDGTRLENYIVTPEFATDIAFIADAIENNDMYGMTEILVGPPGLGKSLAAYATAYIFNWPLRYIQGNKDVTASEFIGAPYANNGVLTTDTKTPLLETMRYGGLCLMDDFTYINEGYTTLLLSVFENPFSLKAADGSIVQRHPMSFMFITANPDCYGSRPMNEAIRSRGYIFHNKAREDITVDSIVDMVCDASKYPIRKDVEIMYDCYEQICNDTKTNSSMIGIAVEPCIRNLISWAKQARVMKNPVTAALYNMIPSLGVTREEERRIFTTIIVPRFPAKYSKK